MKICFVVGQPAGALYFFPVLQFKEKVFPANADGEIRRTFSDLVKAQNRAAESPQRGDDFRLIVVNPCLAPH